jgi:acyl dehydratase
MSEYAAKAHEAMQPYIGGEPVPGEWMEITQERVNAFADATLDHQFIHVDPEAAKDTPFGGTIAHGFLTLSLMVHLTNSVPTGMPEFEGKAMGINYGLNKVRFLSPVPVGSRIRATWVLAAAELKGNAIDNTELVTVELEGSEKPAMIAEFIRRTVYN